MLGHHLTPKLLLPLVIATATIACVEESPVENQSTSPQWTVASLPEDSIEEHPEMLRIAKEVPEFAGFYFDATGQLIVAMTDLTKSSAAEARVRAGFGTHQTARGIVNASTVRLVSRQVEYSFL